MIALSRTPREEMYRAHGLDESGRAPEEPPKRHRNVREVLDLGTVTYISFRGRQYGVPPLPWKEGERLLDAYLEVREFEGDLAREDLRRYFDAVERIAKILWKNVRPLGFARRFLKRLRLLRNPFRDATEGEIGELAVFFLGRRTRSSGFAPPARAPRATSSRTSPSSSRSSPAGSETTASPSRSGTTSTG